MIASTTPGTHNPRISVQTVTNRLLEVCEIPPYTMYVLYAAFLFWSSIYCTYLDVDKKQNRRTGSLFGKDNCMSIRHQKKWSSNADLLRVDYS